MGPEEYRKMAFQLVEYDAKGHELGRRDNQLVTPTTSYAKALFGFVTPMTEAAALVGTSRYLRSEARLQGRTHKPVFLDYLDNTRYFIPGSSRFEESPNGLMAWYIGLIVLSATASAIGCWILARRHAFLLAHCIGWGLVGFLFGWVGLVLMMALQDWPARILCPTCGKSRVVTRDTCEQCGVGHAPPGPDGTEIFEHDAVTLQLVLAPR
jgi:hypothetical protein